MLVLVSRGDTSDRIAGLISAGLVEAARVSTMEATFRSDSVGKANNEAIVCLMVATSFPKGLAHLHRHFF